MSIWEAVILGLVQGAAEFLPISSSGHLVIAEAVFGISGGNLAFTIILHLATFFAVVAAYFETVKNMVIEFFKMLFDLVTFKGLCLDKSKYRRYIIYVIIGCIPAGIVGVLFDDYIETAFSSLLVVGCMLIITGGILILGERVGKNNTLPLEKCGPLKAFITGLFQMCAVMPGLSRSGTTLTGGLVCGIKREDALEFSFLLSLPATLGSVVLKLGDIGDTLKETSMLSVAAGFVTALVVGCLSIALFKKTVKKGSFMGFAAYCIIVGLAVLLNLGRF